jgi:trimethylamine-N-oxide reductase (cytochrome c)
LLESDKLTLFGRYRKTGVRRRHTERREETKLGKIVRKTNSSTGGPVFVDVDVDENKIVRIYPMDFTDEDPKSWEIEARGKKYSPPRKTTYTAYTAGFKAMVHSDRRVLYPLRRIGFDVNGERNIESRGESLAAQYPNIKEA